MTASTSDPAGKGGAKGDLMRFFALAYAITWAFHGAIALFEFENLFASGIPLLLYMLGLLGPMTAAMLLSRRRHAEGVRELMRPILMLRFSPALYLLAFAGIASIDYLSVGIHTVLGGRAPEQWFALPLGMLPLLMGVQIWVVMGEEVGWRGYALPRLQQHFGSLGASLILGLLWTAWHLPMFVMPGTPQYGTSPLRFAAFLTSWSVLCTLLYNRSGRSLFSVMLFHWAVNMWAFAIPMSHGAATWSMVLTVVAAGLAVVGLPRPLFLVAPRTEEAV